MFPRASGGGSASSPAPHQLREEGDRIIFLTKAYIDSFCGIFQLKPGEPSVVQAHLDDRRKERARENAS